MYKNNSLISNLKFMFRNLRIENNKKGLKKDYYRIKNIYIN